MTARRASRHRGRLLLTVAVLTGAFVAPGTAAYAYWSSTSSLSVYVSTLPLALGVPGTVSCTVTGATTRQLTWSPVPAAVGYRVYRASGTQVATTTGTSVSLTEAAMVVPDASHTYSLSVRSYSVTGESPSSVPVSVNFTTGRSTC